VFIKNNYPFLFKLECFLRKVKEKTTPNNTIRKRLPSIGKAGPGGGGTSGDGGPCLAMPENPTIKKLSKKKIFEDNFMLVKVKKKKNLTKVFKQYSYINSLKSTYYRLNAKKQKSLSE
jgi:hypothetical protein